jgi:hypothetical protein
MSYSKDSGMAFKPKTKMQVYTHAINNNARFARGFLMGICTGAIVFFAVLSLAYVFDVGDIQPFVDRISTKSFIGWVPTI